MKMDFKDDYLWDGTGEADPEVERLEKMLGRYRHKGNAPQLPAQPRSWYSTKLAVAAAIFLLALAGLVFVLLSPDTAAPTPDSQAINPHAPEKPAPPDTPAPVVREEQADKVKQELAVDTLPRRKPTNKAPEKDIKEIRPNTVRDEEPEGRMTYIGFLDVETARHLEGAQMLLRSFRNVRVSGEDAPYDISYEKRRSRELLDKNIALRQNAEMRGNLPVEELLGGLEPYLLDIANLSDRPLPEDVRSIKDRIERRDIVATLQVYSGPTVAVNK